MSRKKTHEEYVREVSNINPNIEVVGEYVNVLTKILHRCKIDGHEWLPIPSNILRGHGCPICGNLSIANKLKKTHEQYAKDVASINQNIEVVGTYINNHIKILHRCRIDGYEWLAEPANILSGKGCPKCNNHIQRTHEEYVLDLCSVNPNIEVLEEFVGVNIKILHRCKIDGYEWRVTPNKLLGGRRCPVCSGKKIGNPPKYQNSIWASEYKEYFSKYLTEEQMKAYTPRSNMRVEATCQYCGQKKEVIINDLFSGFSCKCSDNKSYPNKFIYNLLDQLGIKYIPEKMFSWSDKKIYDVYIPDLNCIIENNGIQHYVDVFANYGGRTLKEEKQNDEYKKQLAINNGITHYIIIDCSLSDINYIKNNVLNSELLSILNFNENDICWNKCHEFATSNLVKAAADLWNKNLLIKEIAEELRIHENTVRRYLKTAAELNWCDWYSGIGRKVASSKRRVNHPMSRKVIRLSDRTIYDTIACATRENNMARSTMSKRLKEQRDFMYYDEYLLIYRQD